MIKILLLEDDTVFAESMIDLLESEGFEITHVDNGEAALDATYSKEFDMYLFDVNVPLLDGFDLLGSLRKSGDKTPTIFLTALNDIASLANGFEVGADDYIKKPFEFDELLIRIQAILKKNLNLLNDEIKVGSFRFNIEKNELYGIDGFIALTPNDLKLTRLFFKQPNRTLTKELLMDELYEGKEMSSGVLRVYINKLRNIGLPIVTIKGIGYRFENT